MSFGADPSDVTSPTSEFKDDLRELLEEYNDDVDDEQLRRAAYQVIDYFGAENVARQIRDGELDPSNEDNETMTDINPATGDDHAKTPKELRGDDDDEDEDDEDDG